MPSIARWVSSILRVLPEENSPPRASRAKALCTHPKDQRNSLRDSTEEGSFD